MVAMHREFDFFPSNLNGVRGNAFVEQADEVNTTDVFILFAANRQDIQQVVG